MRSTNMKPLIGLTGDHRFFDEHHWHVCEEHYLTAVIEAADGIPVIIPALADALDQNALLQRLDGLLVTGGVSNILPHYYGKESEQDDCTRDPQRDATDFALIPRALAQGLPFFGICRGLQELNVALGGTLHQRVHCAPGLMDHREPEPAEQAVQYGPSHPVELKAGGLLAGLSDTGSALVNSLHGQGIDRLADDLRVEAVAADGLIEAVSLPSARAFTVAVQWHPEWYQYNTPFCRALLAEFGAQCRAYAARKAADPAQAAARDYPWEL
jgi:putative glutamine amidotransferase